MCKEHDNIKEFKNFEELTQDWKDKFKYNGKTIAGLTRAKNSYIKFVNKLIDNEDMLIDNYISNKVKVHIYYGKCGHTLLEVDGITPDNYKQGKGDCPYCSNKKVLKGFNDLATTHPHLIKYFPNIEDAYTHTYGSQDIVELKCPDCCFIKFMSIANLTSKGFSCDLCSDGMPYPEKLMANVLNKLKIKFKKGLTYDNGKHKYDFYIKDLGKNGTIFETNGNQHYEETNWSKRGGRTLEEEQAIDKYKKDDAIDNHDIAEDDYHQVDCRYSTLEWCRPNIEKALSKYVDITVLTDEDWEEMDLMCQNSNLIKVVNYYNIHKCTASIISKELDIPIPTVCKYLNKGVELGLCDYDGRSNMAKARVNNIPYNKGNGDKYIGINISTNELISGYQYELEQLGFQISNIRKCTKKERKSHKGYKWYYEEDYLKLQEQNELNELN